jgi:hypothetical protein
MSTPQTNQTREALQAVAGLSAQVLKMATHLNTKMASAPKAVSQDQVTKTANALIEHGWVEKGLTKEAVEKFLQDPQIVLEAMESLAAKAAAERGAGDARLSNGRVTKTYEKSASSETNPFGNNFEESEADRTYNSRLSTYTRNGTR